MNLSEHSYPEFDEGQVLTHIDLNRLRDYLASKVAFQNRALFGFGVACGLEGRVAAGNITISPGFALAQGGREIVLAEEEVRQIAAIENRVEDLALDFIDRDVSGFTAVLLPDDTENPAVHDCDDQTGCRTQTITHTEGARIAWVRGQLTLGKLAAHAVFDLEPLSVKGTTAPSAFGSRLEELAKILEKTKKFDAATLALLRKLELKGPPGVDLMKVGLLNEVLQTAQEYFRCRSYDERTCFGPDGAPAVALGFLDPATSTWDCRFRHDYEISPALYNGIRGGRCEDLCQQYVNHIVAIVEDFTPPPAPSGTPGPVKPPGKVHVCKRSQLLTKKCNWRGHKNPKPGKVFIDPNRFKKWPKERPPKFPIPPEDPDWGRLVGGLAGPRVNPILEIMQGFDDVIDTDPTDAGVVNLGDIFGFEKDSVVQELTKEIGKEGVRADIRTMPVADLANEKDFSPGFIAAVTDTIMLGHDAQGAVVAFGSRPTTQALRDVPGVTLKADRAAEAAGRAVERADLAVKSAETAGNLFGEIRTMFGGVRADFAKLRADLPDDATLGQIRNLPQQWSVLKEDMVKRADTERIEGRIAKQEAIIERLEGQTKEVDSRVKLVHDRVDAQSIHFSARAAEDVRASKQVNTRMLTALTTMESAIKAAAPEADRAKVEGILKEAGPALESLRASAERGVPVTETQAEITNTIEVLGQAAKAAGAPAEDVRKVRVANDRLKDALGQIK